MSETKGGSGDDVVLLVSEHVMKISEGEVVEKRPHQKTCLPCHIHAGRIQVFHDIEKNLWWYLIDDAFFLVFVPFSLVDCAVSGAEAPLFQRWGMFAVSDNRMRRFRRRHDENEVDKKKGGHEWEWEGSGY